jgi:hypothetical protein
MKKIDDITSWMTGDEGELQLQLETSPEPQPASSPSKNKTTGEIAPYYVTPSADRPARTSAEIGHWKGLGWGHKRRTDADGDRLVSQSGAPGRNRRHPREHHRRVK